RLAGAQAGADRLAVDRDHLVAGLEADARGQVALLVDPVHLVGRLAVGGRGEAAAALLHEVPGGVERLVLAVEDVGHLLRLGVVHAGDAAQPGEAGDLLAGRDVAPDLEVVAARGGRRRRRRRLPVGGRGLGRRDDGLRLV